MSTGKILNILLSQLPDTIMFVAVSWLLGLGLSVLVTAGRLSNLKWLRVILEVYVSFVRSIPMILQLFLIYYGLPMLVKLIGINLGSVDRFEMCVIAFVLYYGAYLSEDLRPAYLAVDRGQREAAKALGYTPVQVELMVMIPQAVPIALPALGNEILNMVHQSSLLFALGVVDIMGEAQQTINENYTVAPVLVYLLAGLIYWGLTVVIDLVRQMAEKYTGRFMEVEETKK
ncbi:MAG: amino acid ABC transporter permease [Lactobacillus sp.]|nr:amino acid ABC transporter permease [Lactobacillus sp.]